MPRSAVEHPGRKQQASLHQRAAWSLLARMGRARGPFARVLAVLCAQSTACKGAQPCTGSGSVGVGRLWHSKGPCDDTALGSTCTHPLLGSKQKHAHGAGQQGQKAHACICPCLPMPVIGNITTHTCARTYTHARAHTHTRTHTPPHPPHTPTHRVCGTTSVAHLER